MYRVMAPVAFASPASCSSIDIGAHNDVRVSGESGAYAEARAR